MGRNDKEIAKLATAAENRLPSFLFCNLSITLGTALVMFCQIGLLSSKVNIYTFHRTC